MNFFKALETLGIDFRYIANGLIGGFVWALYRKSNLPTAFRQIIIGGIVSAYLTPVVIAHFKVDSMQLISFTSFIIGVLGMVIIDVAYKYLMKKAKSFYEIISNALIESRLKN